MLPLPCRHANLALSVTGVSYSRELGKAKPWMHPALPAGRGRSVQVRRYLIQPVGGKPLPCFEVARAALTRVMHCIGFDLRLIVTLSTNGRGGFLLDVPDDPHTEHAVTQFLVDLDALAA